MARSAGGRTSRVALLAIDPWTDLEKDSNVEFRPFNYPIRRIQASLASAPELQDVEVRLFESSSQDVDAWSTELEAYDPDFIGVSAYVWSFPALLEVCRRARRTRPDRTIVFGGRSAQPEMFALEPFRDGPDIVDALVLGEGEGAIRDLLAMGDRSAESLRTIGGLAVPAGRGWALTGERRPEALDEYPSPYQLGLIPKDVTAHVESYRGCPLSCVFCDWGEVSARPFGYDYLTRELQSLPSAGVRKGICLIDAAINLNKTAFQTLERIERETGAFRAAGGLYCEIYPSHVTDEHLRFLESANARLVGIGLQSLSGDVLSGLDRPFVESRFQRIVGEVASIVPETAVEIMLGLPGDTPENFKRTFDRVRELPVTLRVFHCLALPNALLKNAPARFELQFDPRSLKVTSCLGWSAADLERTYDWLNQQCRTGDSGNSYDGVWNFLPSSHVFKQASGARVPGSVLVPRHAQRAANSARDPHRTGDVNLPAEVLTRWAHILDGGGKLLGGWTFSGDRGRGIALALDFPEGPLQLRAVADDGAVRCYRRVDGVAFSYRRGDSRLTPHEMRALDALILRLGPVMRDMLEGGRMAGSGSRKSLRIIGS